MIAVGGDEVEVEGAEVRWTRKASGRSVGGRLVRMTRDLSTDDVCQLLNGAREA